MKIESRKKDGIIPVILIFAVVLLLVGCSTKGECEDCGQYEKLTKYTYSSGSSVNVCDDCYQYEKFMNSW